MRLKIRSPSGTHVLTLLDTATIADLIAEIRSTTDLGGDLDIKYGYPPRPLPLALHPTSTPLLQLPIKLQGEQLIVSAGTNSGGSVRGSGGSVVHPVEKQDGEKQSGGGAVYPAPTSSSSSSSSSAPFSFTTGQMAPNKPLALARAAPKFNKDDPPDVALPGRGTVVLRVMEDDNSCLFRALSYVMTGSMISVEELRQLVAGTIQEAPETYSKAVLEQHPDSYCEWIKMDSSWGGGIELGILADWFEMEVSDCGV